MKDHISIFLIGCLLAALPSVASDIFIPSIPPMANFLETDIDMIQFAMSIMMAGMSISQLIYGPLSEGIGRKPMLLTGLVVSSLGAAVCSYAHNANTLITGMFLLGVGTGCGSLYRCIFSDCYTGRKLTERSSYATMIYSIMIPCAPLLGGYLQDLFSWQASFTFLCISSACLLIHVLFIFPETNHHRNTNRLHLSFIKHIYQLIITHPPFQCYSICTMLTMLGFFAWMAVMPVIMIKQLGWKPIEFGWLLFSVSITSMSLGGYLNSIAIMYYPIPKIFKGAWSLMLLSSIALIETHLIFGLNTVAMTTCMFVFFLSTSFLWPNYFCQAFAPFQEKSGYANSVYGCMQIAGSSISTFILSFVHDNDPIPLSIVLIISTGLCWICYDYIIVRYEKATS
ncbi:MAG: multidrug effflux MFS transporter [Pseudomonadota bacterium]|nr:multidrug effflux MFS transporter [Pseudomonadota bacterium]